MKIPRRKVLAAAVVLPILAGAAALLQSPAGSGEPLTRFLPAGPLLAVEATNFSGLLAAWNGSPERAAWLASDNYDAFSRSKLFLRLEEARQEFAAAAGVSPDLALVESIAGGESVLGLYDIGGLRFVYITELGAAEAAENALWRSRGDFEPRRAGERQYYVRRSAETGREAAFAVADDRLLLATDSELLAGALELLAGGSRPAASAEPWYADAVANAGVRGELRLVEDLAALTRSPYLRSYWVHDNLPELGQYRAGRADIRFAPEAVVEERLLVRDEPREPVESAALGDLVKLIDDDAGLYRAWAEPDPAAALELLRRKILAPGSDAGAASFGAFGGGFSPDAPMEGDAALERRIDQPPPELSQPAFDPEPLNALLAEVSLAGLLHVQSSRSGPYDVFVPNAAAVVLVGRTAWPQDRVLEAIREAAAGLWTYSNSGAQWSARGPAFELNGLQPLHVIVRGSYLAVANEPELLDALAARFDAASPAEDAAYRARLLHRVERPPALRLMTQLDAVRGGGFDGEPELFSDNIGSLSETLERVAVQEVLRRDRGARVEERVEYRLAP